MNCYRRECITLRCKRQPSRSELKVGGASEKELKAIPILAPPSNPLGKFDYCLVVRLVARSMNSAMLWCNATRSSSRRYIICPEL